MTILLQEPFKSKIEAFKDALQLALTPLFKSNSAVASTELCNGFQADADTLDTSEEMSSARFTFSVSNPVELYCFDMVFDVIAEKPTALMQSIENNAGIVLRLDVRKGENYILVDTLFINFMPNLEKSIDWARQALKNVYSFLFFHEKVQASSKVIPFLQDLKKKYFYVKDCTEVLLNRGALKVNIEIDSKSLAIAEEAEHVICCNLCIAGAAPKDITKGISYSDCKWMYSSSLKRSRPSAVPGIKRARKAVESISAEKLDDLPDIDQYLSKIEESVAQYFYYFNAP